MRGFERKDLQDGGYPVVITGQGAFERAVLGAEILSAGAGVGLPGVPELPELPGENVKRKTQNAKAGGGRGRRRAMMRAKGLLAIGFAAGLVCGVVCALLIVGGGR